MHTSLGSSWRILERSSILSTFRTKSASVISPAATHNQLTLLSSSSSSPSSLLLLSSSSSRSPFARYSYLTTLQVRYASHATQGRANAKARDPAGKRLGAKKTGEQYVVPGNIIFKQRGTKWFPGENCGMGRDHTIYAMQAGYVKYYRDPELHPKRRYIGVCFEREGTLPTPRNAPTRRRLNMIAVPRVMTTDAAGMQEDLDARVDVDVDGVKAFDVESATRANSVNNLQLRPGYMYREANWQIGRAGEKAGIAAPKFDRNDRWLAWRKRQARAQRAAQMKSLKGKKKAGKKGKGR